MHCPHGINPKTCLTCWRLPKPGAAPAAARGPDVERNALGAPMGTLPGRRAAPVVGDREGSDVGKAVCGAPEVSQEARDKYRNPTGKVLPPLPPEQAASLRMDGLSTERAWGVDADGVEVPPERGELIDRQPRRA